ncbi:DUF4232 domain-containing protein [Spirillospora sp. NPDC048911]|uniref:DUF4232 domain-containing protein n=1 Tax=Spirillospora sp. NPDC048911 TaxID=3364527 RepID=UPI0037242498
MGPATTPAHVTEAYRVGVRTRGTWLYIDMKIPNVAAALIVLLALTACEGEKAAAPPGDSGRSDRPTASASPAPADLTTCPKSGIALWIGETSAAMGLRSMNVELYNCGGRNRVLKGYPQIKLLDVDRRPIKASAKPGSSSVATVDSYDRPPRRVTLKPGEVASAGVLWRNLVTGDAAEAVTAEFMEIAPLPGEPTDQLPGVGIDLGTTRKVGIGPWQKVRQAKDNKAGDNGPRPADLPAWLRRVQLGPAERLVGELAFRRLYPELDRLRTQGGFTADSVRKALLGLGFSADTTKATAAQAMQAVAFEVYPGQGACVHGTLQSTRLTAKVEGARVQGGCADT